jgi:hypothetical protein
MGDKSAQNGLPFGFHSEAANATTCFFSRHSANARVHEHSHEDHILGFQVLAVRSLAGVA